MNNNRLAPATAFLLCAIGLFAQADVSVLASALEAYGQESYETTFAMITEGVPDTEMNFAVKKQAASALAEIAIHEYDIKNYRNAYESVRMSLTYDATNIKATKYFLKIRKERDPENLKNEAPARAVTVSVPVPVNGTLAPAVSAQTSSPVKAVLPAVNGLVIEDRAIAESLPASAESRIDTAFIGLLDALTLQNDAMKRQNALNLGLLATVCVFGFCIIIFVFSLLLSRNRSRNRYRNLQTVYEAEPARISGFQPSALLNAAFTAIAHPEGFSPRKDIFRSERRKPLK